MRKSCLPEAVSELEGTAKCEQMPCWQRPQDWCSSGHGWGGMALAWELREEEWFAGTSATLPIQSAKNLSGSGLKSEHCSIDQYPGLANEFWAREEGRVGGLVDWHGVVS